MTSRFALVGLSLSAVLLAAGVLLLQLRGEDPGDVVPRTDRGERPGAMRREGGVAPDATAGPTLHGDAPPPAPAAPIAADECAITGRVLHADTGEGLAGVLLRAVSDGQRFAATVSGPGGRFRLRGPAPRNRDEALLLVSGAWVNAEVARGRALPDVARAWRVPLRPGRAVPWNLRVLPAARIVGTVRDAEGEPVRGARVRIPKESGPSTPGWTQPAFGWHGVPGVRTDDAGRFVLAGLPWGNGVRVEAVRDDGIAADSARVDVRPPDAARVDVTLPAVRAARIRIVDAEAGEPIPDAEVRMARRHERRSARYERRGRTDERGEVRLAPLSAEPSTLSVEALGFSAYASWRLEATKQDAWARFERTPDGDHRATVRLERAAILAGRVVLPEDVPPWTVALVVESADGRDPRQFTTHLDEEGRFRRTVPPGRRWRVAIASSGAASAPPLHLDAVAASGDEDLVLRPEIESPVEEAWDGPVWDLAVVGPEGCALQRAGAAVFWKESGHYPLLVEDPIGGLEATRGCDGMLHLTVPVSPRHGPVWVQVGAEAEGARLARVLHGPLGPEGGTATIVLPRALTVEGRVVDPSGESVQGVEVEIHALRPEGMPASWWFWGRRDGAVCDAEGRFELGDLHAGPYELRVLFAGPWVAPAHERIDAGARGLEVRLLAGLDVRVTVRDEDGAPLAGALLRAYQTDGVRGPDAYYWTRRDEARTDGTGVALLPSLERGGRYSLLVGPPSGRGRDLAEVIRKRWTPGDTEVVLPAFRTVAGRVRTPTGEPAADALVILRHEPTDGTFRTRTDEHGRFAFDDLAPGAGRLGVCWPSLEPDHVPPLLVHETEAGDRDVELVLDPLHVVELDLTGLQGSERRAVVLRLTALDPGATRLPVHHLSATSDQAGVVVRGLQPGVRYRAWATPTKDGRFAWALVEPETDRVALALEQGGTVSGRIVWPGEVDRAWVGIDHQGVVLGHWVSDQPEAFTLRGVPPGTWPVTLRWTVDGEHRRRVLDASAGDDLTFDLGQER